MNEIKAVSRGKALFAVTALFLVGILVGILATHVFYARALRRPGGLADIGLRFVANDLDRRLHLNHDQRRQVDHVLAGTRVEIDGLRQRVTPEFLAILDHARSEIEPLLTPEQRREWERFRGENRARIERFVSGR